MAGTNELQASINGAALADSTGTESITGADASVTVDAAATDDTDPTGYTSSGNIVTFVGGAYDGLQIKIDSDASDIDDVNINITANNSLTMHIGSNQGQTMAVGINDMRARALGVNAVDVTSKVNAEAAIDTIDDAIGLISAERSRLGAYQNRLEHTINNLGVASENLTAAESRIRDVDMAAEMMEFTKKNILAQAGTAMLAQANMRPQQVLQLLQ
jgi:flagellin